jgi:hypothetical protein
MTTPDVPIDLADLELADLAAVPLPALESLPAHSAARELAEAIGRPALAKRVTEMCGPHVGAVLAEAITAAVERRTRAMEAMVAEQLELAHAAIRARWEPVVPEHTAPEVEIAVWSARVEMPG